jgi:polyisoprenoid-binding protein YceI
MRLGRCHVILLATLSVCRIVVAPVVAAQAIDAARSKITIEVKKGGFFSAFGHDHTVTAPIAEGRVDRSENAFVTLRIESGALRVLDPELSPEKRAEVQKTMLGPDVLDVNRFPEIRFASTRIQASGTNAWNVQGELTLHGLTRAVGFPIELRGGFYRGVVKLKQTDFGIQPVSVAGGTVRVKDELRIELEIALAQ